jgi:hypothetical protein
MHDICLFLWNVLCHLVASMSGLASFCMSLWEHTKKERRIESRAFFIVGVLCLIVAFDQAWEDEHRNSTVLIAEKSVLAQERDFWKSQSDQKDAVIRDENKANLGYITAVTETQKTANGTQQSLTELTEKVFETTKPVPGRVITNATRLVSIFDSSKPSDSTVIIVGSVTKDYPSFKGVIECASPFEAREILLSQGVIGATTPIKQGASREAELSFMGSTWRVGEPLFALIHGDRLDPSYCHIKSQ